MVCLLGGIHLLALAVFPGGHALVTKVTGTLMQVIGGLIVLHSVDGNLGLFRKQTLISLIKVWLSDFPMIRRSSFVSQKVTAYAKASARVSVSIKRTWHTPEERLVNIERQIEELDSNLRSHETATEQLIAQVQSEFSSSMNLTRRDLHLLSEQLQKATVGGFKQQAFGVLLAIYGAVISVFV